MIAWTGQTLRDLGDRPARECAEPVLYLLILAFLAGAIHADRIQNRSASEETDRLSAEVAASVDVEDRHTNLPEARP